MYRVTIEQTTALTKTKLSVPVVAIGGKRGLGDRVKQRIQLVAERVAGETILDCGHFVPEEAPRQLVRSIRNVLKIPRR